MRPVAKAVSSGRLRSKEDSFDSDVRPDSVIINSDAQSQALQVNEGMAAAILSLRDNQFVGGSLYRSIQHQVKDESNLYDS